eukprot:6372081-Karenia_brevis.AAC.1
MHGMVMWEDSGSSTYWYLTHPPHPWARVKGPMGAIHMHLMDMGWQARWHQGKLRLKDHHGDVWQPKPQYGMGLLKQMLEEARMQKLWEI